MQALNRLQPPSARRRDMQLTIDSLLAALTEHGNALEIASVPSLARNTLASETKRAILRAH